MVGKPWRGSTGVGGEDRRKERMMGTNSIKRRQEEKEGRKREVFLSSNNFSQ